MNLLFYRYGSICEPDMIDGFCELGYHVTELTEEIHNKNITPKDCLTLVSQSLLNQPQDFVFTVNFFPVISDVCNIFKIPYLCWIVDSPVMELFTKSIQNPCNRIFLFDRMQYREIEPYNPGHIFHFPLGVNVRQKQSAVQNAPQTRRKQFASDVSFVGSLYSEKCPYDKLANPPQYLAGYLNGLIEAQLRVYGYYFIDELLPDNVVADFKASLPGFYTQPPEATFLTDRITVSQLYIGNKITAVERFRTMKRLSEHFSVDLYTGSDTSRLPRVRNRGLAKTMTEMPVIFHESKINLNTTSKAIRSGLPLRIFDIMACGGFVLTNYQAELPELFEIGTDLAAYSSLDELCELCAYYLAHDAKRREIARNGLERVKREYDYPVRLEKLLKLAFTTK